MGTDLSARSRKVAAIRAEHFAEIGAKIETEPNMIKRLIWARGRFGIGLLEARVLIETHHLEEESSTDGTD